MDSALQSALPIIGWRVLSAIDAAAAVDN